MGVDRSLFIHSSRMTVTWFSVKGVVFIVFDEADRSLLLTVTWFSWPFMVFHEAERSLLLTVAWFL